MLRGVTNLSADGHSGGGEAGPAGSPPQATARAHASWRSSARWRDEVLLPTRMGRAAVACYDRLLAMAGAAGWRIVRASARGCAARLDDAGAEDRVTMESGTERGPGEAPAAPPRRFPLVAVALLASASPASSGPGCWKAQRPVRRRRASGWPPTFRLEKFGGGEYVWPSSGARW